MLSASGRASLFIIFLFICFSGTLKAETLPFQIHTLNTKWFESPLPQENSHVVALFRSPVVRNGIQATLSVRLDQPVTSAQVSDEGFEDSRKPASVDLRKYSQRWLSDFPHFGFKVLKTETRQLNGETAIVADLQDPQKGRQQRQMLRSNGRQIAILTCTDATSTFPETVRACEILMSTFRWNQENGSVLHHSPAVY